MRSINRYLLKEHYPDHPDDIVIQNRFYPDGLTQVQIYNHYLTVERNMLNWIDGRHVSFLLSLGDESVLKRKDNNNQFLKLASNNFEDLITGRTMSVYVTQPKSTNCIIVDIDPGKNMGRRDALLAAKTGYDIIKKNFPCHKTEFITSSSIGVHVVCTLSHLFDITELRTKLKEVFNSSLKNSSLYLVDKKGRIENRVNFDFSSMAENGLHICKYSLTKEGLVCTDVHKGLVTI